MKTLLDALSPIIDEVIATHSSSVDRENRFPHESVGALRAAGLLRYGLPESMAGYAFRLPEFCQAAALIGERCLSTAVIWTMHCQQLAALSASAFGDKQSTLQDICDNQRLVASVTTELVKGGDFLHAHAPLHQTSRGTRVERRAPIVSYGKQADYFLVTMRGGHSDSATCLVLVGREDGHINAEGSWNALGMRGTQSLPMSFDVVVRNDRVIPEFLSVALRWMIPIAHLGWSSAWFGAAKGLYNRVVRSLRKAGASAQRNLDSELLRFRLGEVRSHLDMLEALIGLASSRIAELHASNAPLDAYKDPSLSILVNNVKIAVSRHAFTAVDEMMELCGLFDGYLSQSETALEQVFRDVRSATLMFKNDRLLDANGRLAFVEGARLFSAGLGRAYATETRP